MIPKYLKDKIIDDDLKFKKYKLDGFELPEYNPESHYLELTRSNYFEALITLRHYIKSISDYYFGIEQGAKNIDLFMLTPSVSSPMGPGSDSEAIAIKFGKNKTFLVDSSQFGFEPLLLNEFEKVYCYLPSMRGENPDKRHLNQFYHCELEIRGSIEDLIPIIEGYIKTLCDVLLSMDNIIKKISTDYEITKKVLEKVSKTESFKKITFDDAIDLLVKNDMHELINFTDHGRDIKAEGELQLMKLLNTDLPVWIMYYDRDRVPFYQKPLSENKNKVINADLIFPSIINNGFGGEIVGCGQRQDNTLEMYESLKRQNNISADCYEWYINLRRDPRYKITSGFGLGIERFIAWALGKDNIRDVILYPRIKNLITYP